MDRIRLEDDAIHPGLDLINTLVSCCAFSSLDWSALLDNPLVAIFRLHIRGKHRCLS